LEYKNYHSPPAGHSEGIEGETGLRVTVENMRTGASPGIFFAFQKNVEIVQKGQKGQERGSGKNNFPGKVQGVKIFRENRQILFGMNEQAEAAGNSIKNSLQFTAFFRGERESILIHNHPQINNAKFPVQNGYKGPGRHDIGCDETNEVRKPRDNIGKGIQQFAGVGNLVQSAGKISVYHIRYFNNHKNKPQDNKRGENPEPGPKREKKGYKKQGRKKNPERSKNSRDIHW
jgi:hypothetical protein